MMCYIQDKWWWSLRTGLGCPHKRIQHTGGSMRPTERENKKKKTQSPEQGTRKTRYYQPGQLDLVTQYWSKFVKPDSSMGDGNTTGAAYSTNTIGCLQRPPGREWVYATDHKTNIESYLLRKRMCYHARWFAFTYNMSLCGMMNFVTKPLFLDCWVWSNIHDKAGRTIHLI